MNDSQAHCRRRSSPFSPGQRGGRSSARNGTSNAVLVSRVTAGPRSAPSVHSVVVRSQKTSPVNDVHNNRSVAPAQLRAAPQLIKGNIDITRRRAADDVGSKKAVVGNEQKQQHFVPVSTNVSQSTLVSSENVSAQRATVAQPSVARLAYALAPPPRRKKPLASRRSVSSASPSQSSRSSSTCSSFTRSSSNGSSSDGNTDAICPHCHRRAHQERQSSRRRSRSASSSGNRAARGSAAASRNRSHRSRASASQRASHQRCGRKSTKTAHRATLPLRATQRGNSNKEEKASTNSPSTCRTSTSTDRTHTNTNSDEESDANKSTSADDYDDDDDSFVSSSSSASLGVLTDVLPRDLYLHICSFLDESACCTLLEVSLRMHAAITSADSYVWRRLCMNTWAYKQGFQNFIQRVHALEVTARREEREVQALQQHMLLLREQDTFFGESDVSATCDDATVLIRRRQHEREQHLVAAANGINGFSGVLSRARRSATVGSTSSETRSDDSSEGSDVDHLRRYDVNRRRQDSSRRHSRKSTQRSATTGTVESGSISRYRAKSDTSVAAGSRASLATSHSKVFAGKAKSRSTATNTVTSPSRSRRHLRSTSPDMDAHRNRSKKTTSSSPGRSRASSSASSSSTSQASLCSLCRAERRRTAKHQNIESLEAGSQSATAQAKSSRATAATTLSGTQDRCSSSDAQQKPNTRARRSSPSSMSHRSSSTDQRAKNPAREQTASPSDERVANREDGDGTAEDNDDPNDRKGRRVRIWLPDEHDTAHDGRTSEAPNRRSSTPLQERNTHHHHHHQGGKGGSPTQKSRTSSQPPPISKHRRSHSVKRRKPAKQRRRKRGRSRGPRSTGGGGGRHRSQHHHRSHSRHHRLAHQHQHNPKATKSTRRRRRRQRNAAAAAAAANSEDSGGGGAHGPSASLRNPSANAASSNQYFYQTPTYEAIKSTTPAASAQHVAPSVLPSQQAARHSQAQQQQQPPVLTQGRTGGAGAAAASDAVASGQVAGNGAPVSTSLTGAVNHNAAHSGNVTLAAAATMTASSSLFTDDASLDYGLYWWQLTPEARQRHLQRLQQRERQQEEHMQRLASGANGTDRQIQRAPLDGDELADEAALREWDALEASFGSSAYAGDDEEEDGNDDNNLDVHTSNETDRTRTDTSQTASDDDTDEGSENTNTSTDTSNHTDSGEDSRRRSRVGHGHSHRLADSGSHRRARPARTRSNDDTRSSSASPRFWHTTTLSHSATSKDTRRAKGTTDEADEKCSRSDENTASTSRGNGKRDGDVRRTQEDNDGSQSGSGNGSLVGRQLARRATRPEAFSHPPPHQHQQNLAKSSGLASLPHKLCSSSALRVSRLAERHLAKSLARRYEGVEEAMIITRSKSVLIHTLERQTHAHLPRLLAAAAQRQRRLMLPHRYTTASAAAHVNPGRTSFSVTPAPVHGVTSGVPNSPEACNETTERAETSPAHTELAGDRFTAAPPLALLRDRRHVVSITPTPLPVSPGSTMGPLSISALPSSLSTAFPTSVGAALAVPASPLHNLAHISSSNTLDSVTLYSQETRRVNRAIHESYSTDNFALMAPEEEDGEDLGTAAEDTRSSPLHGSKNNLFDSAQAAAAAAAAVTATGAGDDDDVDEDKEPLAPVSWKFAFFMSRREARRAKITLQDLLEGMWVVCFRSTGRSHPIRFTRQLQVLVYPPLPTPQELEEEEDAEDVPVSDERPASSATAASGISGGSRPAAAPQAAPPSQQHAPTTAPPLPFHILQGGALLVVHQFPPMKVVRRNTTPSTSPSPSSSAPAAAFGVASGASRLSSAASAAGATATAALSAALEAERCFLAEPQATLRCLQSRMLMSDGPDPAAVACEERLPPHPPSSTDMKSWSKPRDGVAATPSMTDVRRAIAKHLKFAPSYLHDVLGLAPAKNIDGNDGAIGGRGTVFSFRGSTQRHAYTRGVSALRPDDSNGGTHKQPRRVFGPLTFEEHRAQQRRNAWFDPGGPGDVLNDWGWTIAGQHVKIFSLDVTAPLYVERLQRVVDVEVIGRSRGSDQRNSSQRQ